MNKEKLLIIFGKQGSRVDLVGNALLGIGNDDANGSDRKPSLGKNLKRHILSSGIEEVEALNVKFKRLIKIAYLSSDDVTSLSANALSPLLTTDDFTVVYCFPISYRFTTEDWHLLQRYLPYSKMKHFKRTTIVFTYSERLNPSENTDDYIKTLPDEFQKLIKKCGNKCIFISSSEDASSKNVSSIESLIEPVPMEYFKGKLFLAIVLFLVDPGFWRLVMYAGA